MNIDEREPGTGTLSGHRPDERRRADHAEHAPQHRALRRHAQAARHRAGDEPAHEQSQPIRTHGVLGREGELALILDEVGEASPP